MNDEPEVVLDLSRLLSRVLHPTPTGVDRVEMAYARGLMTAIPDRLRFAAVHPTGMYGRLPRDAVVDFLDATEHRWQAHGRGAAGALRASATRALWNLRPRMAARAGERRLYVQASPNNLTKPDLIRAILKRENARFVCLLHDLIPVQYPEYARPGGAGLHHRRIDTLVGLADGIVANSHATLAAVQPYVADSGRSPELRVAHLGTDDIVRPTTVRKSERPYFVCVGTIEPRKNHLLLLHLWRALSEERGAHAIPKLLVVGRRGWENEQVVDMLERCPALEGCVEEHGGLPDAEVQALIAGSRGLLLPSFAEGYGMPVVEALSLGVPVLCSNLGALREAGGDVPTFLDPLDGPAWRAAIDDLSQAESAIAAAQTARLARWQAPRWDQHIAILLDLLHRLRP
jgi:glycosyltransferase involved in cell wall biosynthesis